MADQSCNSAPESTTNASHSKCVDSGTELHDSVSGSGGSNINTEETCFGGDKTDACKNQPPQSNVDSVSSDQSHKSNTEGRNGVSEACLHKKSTFLAPPILCGVSNTILSSHNSASPSAESPPATRCPLKSPRLNLTPSRFGNLDSSSPTTLGSKLPFQQLKSPFSSAVSFENDNNESVASKNNVLKTDNISSCSTDEKLSKPFTSFSSSKPVGSSNKPSSSMLTTNFVFGQNLHERVADGIANTNTSKINNTEKSKTEESNSNGASDMLFTSVLTSKEIKDNLNTDSGSNREPFSLIEDAARCQEARANKRKYEEVLVTTGEEDEENILQVSVMLFAFDSGTWVERGRGILRLNDKNCDGTVVSRIVIRTVGSLRVVLNTKIWSGMLLSRASERSIRITAMDPSGQLKIFLIQASPKDMDTLFLYLDLRLKRCKEIQGEPEKKKAEKVIENADEGDKNET